MYSLYMLYFMSTKRLEQIEKQIETIKNQLQDEPLAKILKKWFFASKPSYENGKESTSQLY